MADPDRGPHYAHVLVPLDGSDLAAAAVDTAQALADRFGAELHAVTVADSQTGVADRCRAVAMSIAGRIADERLHADVDVDAAAAILRRADTLGSCLVCTSTHGRCRIAGAVVGSVARTVFERGAGPIVAVGPNADRFPPFMSHKPDVLSAAGIVHASRSPALVVPLARAGRSS